MEDRTRRMLVGLVFAAGAIALSASTAGAQSPSNGSSPSPKATIAADNGGSSGGSMPGGCGGMHTPDDGGTGGTTAANLT